MHSDEHTTSGRHPLLSIIHNNVGLKLLYLEYLARGKHGAYPAVEKLHEFLLWFASVASAKFPNISYFPETYVDLLRVPVQGRSLLEFWLSSRPSLLRSIASQTGNREPYVIDSLTFPNLQPFLPPHLVPPISSADRLADDHQLPDFSTGVSVVGFFKYAIGIGEDARTLFDIISRMNIPSNLVDIGNHSINLVHNANFISSIGTQRPIFPVVIFCCPLFEMAKIISDWGDEALKNRYVIGYWPWELEELPPGWDVTFSLIDEIWSSSHFTCNTFRRLASCPVYKVPLVVSIPEFRDYDKADHNVRTFNVLAVADFNSAASRKNPFGAIEAFSEAFPSRENVTLTLKTSHLGYWPSDAAELERICDLDRRIKFIDENLERSKLYSLIASSDVYISLHRSEGFGRVMAEAMLLRTPVVCTGWSGSLDFADEETAFLVDYCLRPVGDEEYPYACGQWAEPIISSAAAQLAHLYHHSRDYRAKLESARNRILASYSPGVVAGAVLERLLSIRETIRSRVR